MRLGFFTSIEGWGGSETYLLSLMKGVRDAGHVPALFGIEGTRLYCEAREANIECVAWKGLKNISVNGVPVVTGVPAGSATRENEDATETSLRQGYDGHAAATTVKQLFLRGMPHGLKLLAGNVREVLMLRRLFRNHRVDVMHVNLNGYEVAGVACKLCGIPSVGWHCIMPYHDPSAMRRWLLKWTCWSYSVMGGMSQACVDAWRGLSGLPTRRCRMVWNGIDLSKYKAKSSLRRSVSDAFQILAVGRLHPMKGFNVLIKALGLLNDPRVILIVAGEGSDDQKLKTLAAEQPCSQTIHFLGHREDMETLYQQAHCLALPSVSHESFGFVLAEAMAFGLPTITSDFGPLPEINIDGETGLVVPSGNAESLSRAIQHLADHPDECVRFGRNGVRRAMECFSKERMVTSMMDIYKGLI